MTPLLEEQKAAPVAPKAGHLSRILSTPIHLSVGSGFGCRWQMGLALDLGVDGKWVTHVFQRIRNARLHLAALEG